MKSEIFIGETMIYELKVSGMHCESCISLIRMGLEEINGVSKVSGDSKKGIVQVVFDEKVVNISDIVKKIEQEGYKVTNSESRKK